MEYVIALLESELKQLKLAYHAASPDCKGDIGDNIYAVQGALGLIIDAEGQ